MFQVDQEDPFIRGSSGSAYTNFWYDMIRFMKPKTFVELGTGSGASFFSCCQAVTDATLKTTCFAIDEWAGDLQHGRYGEETFSTVHRIQQKYFSYQTTLLRTSFDTAVLQFQKNSIDVLHIKKPSTYETILHDFEMWLPTIKPNGVVCIADIMGNEGEIGASRAWQELQQRYPHVSFSHASGLGILFPKGYSSKWKPILQNTSALQRHYQIPPLLLASKEAYPLVSILIPTYNRPIYLEKALQSVLNQTYPNIEILIGDDSTSDDTKQLIQTKFLPRHSHITYIKNNQTLGQHRNQFQLFQEAKGEYINYVMDDDLLHPDKITKMMWYYLQDLREEISLITSHRHLINDAGQILPPIFATKRLFVVDTILNGSDIGKNILTYLQNWIGEPTTVLFRKKQLVEPFGSWQGRTYACNVDIASWLSLLTKGKMVYLTDSLSSFRLHSHQQQQQQEKSLEGLEDWYHAIQAGKETGFLQHPTAYETAIKHFKQRVYELQLSLPPSFLSTHSWYSHVFGSPSVSLGES